MFFLLFEAGKEMTFGLRLGMTNELTAAYLSSNVEGNIFGKSLSATGRRSSMNGTMMNTEKGTSRNRSWVVRFSWKKRFSGGVFDMI